MAVGALASAAAMYVARDGGGPPRDRTRAEASLLPKPRTPCTIPRTSDQVRWSIVSLVLELRNTRRIAIRQLLSSAAAFAAMSAGQTADGKRPPRIGFMTGVGFPELEAAFTDELRKLGVVEGRDVVIERRFTRPNTDDSHTMSAELANSDLAFIVVSALPLALNVRDANPRMPMIIGTCPGMVSNGFAQTLERPGGIYTGIDELPPGVTAKRLQLLKTAAPSRRRRRAARRTAGDSPPCPLRPGRWRSGRLRRSHGSSPGNVCVQDAIVETATPACSIRPTPTTSVGRRSATVARPSDRRAARADRSTPAPRAHVAAQAPHERSLRRRGHHQQRFVATRRM